jgi:hypothetical protein
MGASQRRLGSLEPMSRIGRWQDVGNGRRIAAFGGDSVVLWTAPCMSGFAPAPLMEHLVTAGYLGRKTGRGFRDHS